MLVRGNEMNHSCGTVRNGQNGSKGLTIMHDSGHSCVPVYINRLSIPHVQRQGPELALDATSVGLVELANPARSYEFVDKWLNFPED